VKYVTGLMARWNQSWNDRVIVMMGFHAMRGAAVLCLVGLFLGVVSGVVVPACRAQDAAKAQPQQAATPENQLAVNWIYGAYVPKDAPLVALTGDQRLQLWVRQSFTLPGIYIKTGFFTLHDQVRDTPPEWGDGIEGFGKRLGTRHAQYLMQNAFTSGGDAALGWEPRYDRCRCTGFWPRTRHALKRNFVTYERSEQHLRPQIMPYAAAFGAGAITATWEPANTEILTKGYQSAVTQIWWGSMSNMLGEFAPDVMRKLRKPKKD
jgi:hypothetical protein